MRGVIVQLKESSPIGRKFTGIMGTDPEAIMMADAATIRAALQTKMVGYHGNLKNTFKTSG